MDAGKTVLIVLAHPEPASFTAAWAEASAEGAEAAGARVLWSDLCAMGFDPVEGPERYYDPRRAVRSAQGPGGGSGGGKSACRTSPAEVAKIELADMSSSFTSRSGGSGRPRS
jgi:NAD(P)H dehydrogenase (quinone)